MAKYTYSDIDSLSVRLVNIQNQGRRLAILIGSGLTMQNLKNNEIGVSSVADIVENIKSKFEKHGKLHLLERNINLESSMADKYQASMSALLATFGQDELNNTIIRAVMNAMPKKIVLAGNEQELRPEILESEPNNWYLRKGIDALGELYVDFKDMFSGPILTSNFDPLLEVSIRKHGGNPQSIFIVNDGKFLNHKSDAVHSVVHFHGYWHGGDTLHTPDQLRRERPQLKGDLKKLFQNSVLLVIGYGGWNDVFTNTLLDLQNSIYWQYLNSFNPGMMKGFVFIIAHGE